jgi:hypothetical protein
MIAGRYNIVADQGSTFERGLVLKDAAGVLWDLTDYTGAMQVRTQFGGTVVLSLSTAGANPGITLGGTAGTILLEASATVMAAITPATYFYDLELTSSAGEVIKPVRGDFTVRPEVTL